MKCHFVKDFGFHPISGDQLGVDSAAHTIATKPADDHQIPLYRLQRLQPIETGEYIVAAKR
jgi:hypothetical protein